MGTFLKISRKAQQAGRNARAFYQGRSITEKALVQVAVMSVLLLSPELALAQSSGGSGSGNNFFCVVAQYMKQIIGGAALVAICFWAVEHFFKVSKIHDIVIGVGVGCAVVMGATALIAGTGLSANCTF